MRAIIEKNPIQLMLHFNEIIALSNAERNALGFLPNAAYRDAIAQRRIIALLREEDSGRRTLAGYILHGGIFPHARVQQICTKPEFRKLKIASALIDTLVADLERAGFLTIKANVADDLPHAQVFYERLGFEAITSKPGGITRGRKIVIRVRNLDTPNLFSLPPSTIKFGFSSRYGKEVSFYTFDLNVFFDLVKNRQRYEAACHLFGAALDHRIRLGIASEFVTELKRYSSTDRNDPVLQMALQLPRLPPPVDPHKLDRLAEEIYEIVFGRGSVAGAGSIQARSDARHLAHSALSKISGFITSDRAILEARDALLTEIGIDVAGLDELLALLPERTYQQPATTRQGGGFECRVPTVPEAVAYLEQSGVPKSLIESVCGPVFSHDSGWSSAIWEGSRIVALAYSSSPVSTAGDIRLLIYVDQERLDREFYCEYLLDAAIKDACRNGPAAIRLLNLRGQSSVKATAKLNGFVTMSDGDDLMKVAIGRPLTEKNWDFIRHNTRRKTGLVLPKKWSEFSSDEKHITVGNSLGQTYRISPERFEDTFGPTLYLWPGREAVIVPIWRTYADELLGTNTQKRLSFIEDLDASFLSRRAYINTPRARNSMRPGLPILFYESGKNGGRSAIVAVARIVNSVLVSKEFGSREAKRRVVVDDLSEFSATGDVLMTTFDNLMALPTPVRFDTLKKLGAVARNNLVSATPVSSENLIRIIEAAWTQ